MTTTNRPIRRALVSVFHKEGIEVLAEAFIKAGTEVVSHPVPPRSVWLSWVSK